MGVKMLFGHNVSLTLVDAISDLFPGSIHLQDLMPADTLDPDVYHFAVAHGFAGIVTCDEHFVAIAKQFGWLRIVRFRSGELKTAAAARLLRHFAADIREFLLAPRDDPDQPVVIVIP